MDAQTVRFTVECACGNAAVQTYTEKAFQSAIEAGRIRHYCTACDRLWLAEPADFARIKLQFYKPARRGGR